jgi:hypothetical protein
MFANGEPLAENRRGNALPARSDDTFISAATGYKLANQGVDTRSLPHYLGHKNIQHTTRYAELAADRFKDFSRD